MQLVFTFCQTSFPARHALQSAAAFLFKYWSIHCLLAGVFLSVLHCIQFIVHCPWKAEIMREKKILFIQYMHTKGKNSMIMEKQSNSDCFTTECGASHAMWHLKYMNSIKAQEMAARRTCNYLQVSIAVESKFQTNFLKKYSIHYQVTSCCYTPVLKTQMVLGKNLFIAIELIKLIFIM